VFALDGTPLTTFPIRGWYDELGNRPYLAVDPARNLLYVTDPDAGRVLVLNTDGACVGAFGGLNRENPNSAQFATIGGIAVDGDGFVHVVDLSNGRLLKFAPFEVEDAGITLDSAPSELGADLGDDTSGSVEIPADLPAEATVELSE
jgi:DNA-binding beta-propeller fold protein YncE